MRYRLIDAFTDEPFTGNPAAVFLLSEQAWPDDRWMQRVALELSVSETAFAHPLPADAPAGWALRWFTPIVEDELCGHATLATTHALCVDRDHKGVVRFLTRSGVLSAWTNDDGKLTLDFPRAQLSQVEPPEDLVEAIGAHPDATYETGALGDVLAVFADEDTVRAINPDFAALADMHSRASHRPDRGTIVTAPAGESRGRCDFASRFFTPRTGIPEDPVTGSAHTALAPYWSTRFGRNTLTGLCLAADRDHHYVARRGPRPPHWKRGHRRRGDVSALGDGTGCSNVLWIGCEHPAPDPSAPRVRDLLQVLDRSLLQNAADGSSFTQTRVKFPDSLGPLLFFRLEDAGEGASDAKQLRTDIEQNPDQCNGLRTRS